MDIIKKTYFKEICVFFYKNKFENIYKFFIIIDDIC